MLLRVSEIYQEMLNDFYSSIFDIYVMLFKYKFVNIILRMRKIQKKRRNIIDKISNLYNFAIKKKMHNNHFSNH